MTIAFFKKQYAFLSNFAEINIVIDDKLWRTSEHMYIACKTLDPIIQEKIRLCNTPGSAKKLGSQIKLRSNWEFIKRDAMLDCLMNKFTRNKIMEKKLINTASIELIEGNYWHDNYWGRCMCDVCNNTGLNTLGKLLMKVRNEIKLLQVKIVTTEPEDLNW